MKRFMTWFISIFDLCLAQLQMSDIILMGCKTTSISEFWPRDDSLFFLMALMGGYTSMTNVQVKHVFC